jgi:hypothetical protein
MSPETRAAIVAGFRAELQADESKRIAKNSTSRQSGGGGGADVERRHSRRAHTENAAAPAVSRAFAVVEQAAIAGARCPFSEAIPGGNHSLRQLTRNGIIRVEIGLHNWRVVTILAGPAAGKATAQPAGAWNPYLVIDGAGRRFVKRIADARGKALTQARSVAPPPRSSPKPRPAVKAHTKEVAAPIHRPRPLSRAGPKKELRSTGRNAVVPCHTQETIDAVARLWADPAMSDSKIGKALGLTKNAVIGIRSRNDMPPRGKTKAEIAAEKREAIAFPKNGCLFSFGEVGAPGFHFCGARPRGESEPWCAKHHRIVFVPPGKRETALKQIDFVAGKSRV